MGSLRVKSLSSKWNDLDVEPGGPKKQTRASPKFNICTVDGKNQICISVNLLNHPKYWKMQLTYNLTSSKHFKRSIKLSYL